MLHDIGLIARVRLLKLARWGSGSLDWDAEESWRKLWNEIYAESYEPRDSLFPHNPISRDGIVDSMRRHRLECMSEIADDHIYPWSEKKWRMHCTQIFTLATYGWAGDAVQLDEFPLTTEGCHSLLMPGTDLKSFLEGPAIVLKQEQELKYISIESEYPEQLVQRFPRDSVEPMPWNSLRNTDELHHGKLRMTDEAVLDNQQQRKTDEGQG